jgi:hypothetical protein
MLSVKNVVERPSDTQLVGKRSHTTAVFIIIGSTLTTYGGQAMATCMYLWDFPSH